MENKTIEEMFPSVVGQKSILNKLKFFCDIQHKEGYFPPTLITGQRGAGKNSIGRALIKQLFPQNDKTNHKTAIEINCNSIQSKNDFFDQIVNVYLLDKEISIILDEFHSFSNTDIYEMFLSVWNTQDFVTNYIHNGQTYTFDTRKISWICLTSEPNQIPDTLISRLEVLQLEELSLNDLSHIVGKNLKNIKVDKELLMEVASVARQNGRESYKLGQNIKYYLKALGETEFKLNHWKDIKNKLGIRKDGLNNIEFRILKYLKENNNGVSLTKLSAALQLTNESARLGYEKYLLARNLIEVVNAKGRILSKQGYDYLKEVERENNQM